MTRRTLICSVMALVAVFTTLFAAPRAAQAALGTSIGVRFEPAQSRYPRGTVITLAARLAYGGGGVPGRWVELFELSTRGQRSLGWACTDGAGWARLRYTVPTDPNKDNVCIFARFYGDAMFAPSSNYPGVRIPIGTW